MQIADNTANDWLFNRETGKLRANKGAMLRSKLRIETRQWQMSRLVASLGPTAFNAGDWGGLKREGSATTPSINRRAWRTRGPFAPVTLPREGFDRAKQRMRSQNRP